MYRFGLGLSRPEDAVVVPDNTFSQFGYTVGMTVTKRGVTPNYDGYVGIMMPDGQFIHGVTPDVAGEYAAQYGHIFVNGSLNTFWDAKENAMKFAQSLNKPVVWIYHSQDIDYWNLPNQKFISLLQDLMTYSSAAAGQRGTTVTTLCHSNACYKSALTAWSFGNINLYEANPAHWFNESSLNYRISLENYRGKVMIANDRADSISAWGNAAGWRENVYGVPVTFGQQWVLDLDLASDRITGIQYGSHQDYKLWFGDDHTFDSLMWGENAIWDYKIFSNSQ